MMPVRSNCATTSELPNPKTTSVRDAPQYLASSRISADDPTEAEKFVVSTGEPLHSIPLAHFF
jgi:hypothetical protein